MLKSVGFNAYEAGVNAVAGAIVLSLRSKKMPTLNHMLMFGLEKAIINVIGSYVGSSIDTKMSGVSQLDVEYLSNAIAAAMTSYWNRRSGFDMASEQLMVSLISHLITTRTLNKGIPQVYTAFGGDGFEAVNPSTSLY